MDFLNYDFLHVGSLYMYMYLFTKAWMHKHEKQFMLIQIA